MTWRGLAASSSSPSSCMRCATGFSMPTCIREISSLMGRIAPHERRFLAEILYGLVTRDYVRVAEVHFEAGYVPRSKNIHAFAQAIRAVAEPVFGRPAREVSMGKLLAQLFQVTDQFDMRTRPELILLQKTMVVVEGVARYFDPDHNIWESAEPVL